MYILILDSSGIHMTLLNIQTFKSVLYHTLLSCLICTNAFAETSISQNNLSYVNLQPQSTLLQEQNKLYKQQDLIQWIKIAQKTKLDEIEGFFQKQTADQQCQYNTKLINKIQGISKIAVWNYSILINNIVQQKIALNAQLSSIKNKISTLQQERDRIGLPRLQYGLETLIDELKNKYKAISRSTKLIAQKKQQIQINNNKLLNIRKQRQDYKQQLNQKNIQLKLHNFQIQILQKQLKNIRNIKQTIVNEIQQISDYIEQSQESIQSLQTKTNQIYQQIQQIQGFQVRTNLQSLVLQSQITKSQTKIDDLTSIYQQVISQLSSTQQQFQFISSKLAQIPNPSIFSTRINLLTNFIQTLKSISTKLYYICFIDINIPKILDNSYIVLGTSLPPYLQKMFTKKVSLPEITDQFSYKLTQIDLFGSDWTRKFGFPFDEQSLNPDTLFLQNDLTCKQQYSIMNSYVGSGILTFINRNSIQIVDKNKTKLILRLGACTRLQSASQFPTINNLIYFRGFYISNNILSVDLVTTL